MMSLLYATGALLIPVFVVAALIEWIEKELRRD